MRRFAVVLLMCAVLDGALSTLFFCRFDAGLAKLIVAHVTYFNYFVDFPDLWFLALLRCCIIAGGAIGIIWRPKVSVPRIPAYSYCLEGFATLGIFYVLIKFLATSEAVPTYMNDIFFWLQISWGFASNLFLFGAAYAIASKSRKLIADKEKLDKQRKDSESTEQLIVNDAQTEDPAKLKEKDIPKKSGIKRLITFSKPDAHLLFIAFIFLLIAAVADVLSPNYIGQVISGIVINRSSDVFIRAIILFAVTSVVSSLATGIRGGIFTLALARLAKRTRQSLFSAVMRQEVSFFDETRTGDIMSRLSADVATMSDTLAMNLNIFLRNFVKAVGISFMMFSLSWRLSLVTIAGLPLIALTNQFFGNLYEKLSSAVQDAISKTSQVAEEAISNFRTVLSLAGEPFELTRYCDNLVGVYKIQIKEAFVYSCSIWSTSLLSLSLTLATLYYGGHLVITNQLNSSDLVTFLLYQINLGDCLQGMGAVYTGLMQALGASRKVVEYLDRVPAHRRSGPLKPASLTGRIEFKNVSFSYPTRKGAPVLKNISFVVEPGQVVALVGKSGSGKSSCLALLERFYEPLSGQILLDGVPVGEYDHSFLHQAIAMVQQEPVLFARSIRENILFAMDPSTNEENIFEAARMADADAFVGNLPNKYETECGEKGIQLSGGQKQRIAIARAVIRKPQVLLLDEATSALDATAEAAVQAALSRAMTGRTVLVVAHRLSTIRNANLILVLDRGKIVESGTHDQLVALNGHYSYLVNKQLSVGANSDETSKEEESPVSVHQPIKSAVQTVAEVHRHAESMALSISPGNTSFLNTGKLQMNNAAMQGSPDQEKRDDGLNV